MIIHVDFSTRQERLGPNLFWAWFREIKHRFNHALINLFPCKMLLLLSLIRHLLLNHSKLIQMLRILEHRGFEPLHPYWINPHEVIQSRDHLRVGANQVAGCRLYCAGGAGPQMADLLKRQNNILLRRPELFLQNNSKKQRFNVHYNYGIRNRQ